MMHPAYVAGLIDGEGTINMFRSGGTFVPRISVANTDFGVLEDLKEQYDGVICIARRANPNWALAGHWHVVGSIRVALVLNDVWPHLRIKFPQAFLVAQVLGSYYRGDRRWFEVRKTPDGAKAFCTQEAQEWRHEIHGALQILNKRGIKEDLSLHCDVEMEPLLREARQLLRTAVTRARNWGNSTRTMQQRTARLAVA